jgi:hypothetical protein
MEYTDKLAVLHFLAVQGIQETYTYDYRLHQLFNQAAERVEEIRAKQAKETT